MDFLDNLTTEQPNPKSLGIDKKPTLEILKIINSEDRTVPLAIESQIPVISSVVDTLVECFKGGGRLFYVGAGTSGRLGVLDASECPPTFGTDPAMVQGIIAGGPEALVRSIEWAEDNEDEGAREIDGRAVCDRDFLIGITASGQAPFVIGAMQRAAELGACVAALSCNKDSRTFAYADYKIFIDVGPEIVSGSTRMKSGTAQKLVMNMITTAAMIRLGKVYNNLMIDLKPVNNKLVRRSKRLIRLATGCDSATAERVFEESGRSVKTAVVMVILGRSRQSSEELLAANGGIIGPAIDAGRSEQA